MRVLYGSSPSDASKRVLILKLPWEGGCLIGVIDHLPPSNVGDAAWRWWP